MDHFNQGGIMELQTTIGDFPRQTQEMKLPADMMIRIIIQDKGSAKNNLDIWPSDFGHIWTI